MGQNSSKTWPKPKLKSSNQTQVCSLLILLASLILLPSLILRVSVILFALHIC